MSHVLQPDSNLGNDIRGESEMRIDANGGLVEDQFRVGVTMPIMELRFWGGTKILIRAAKEERIFCCVEACMGEDDGGADVK